VVGESTIKEMWLLWPVGLYPVKRLIKGKERAHGGFIHKPLHIIYIHHIINPTRAPDIDQARLPAKNDKFFLEITRL
jgi:hypothetical protein